MLFQKIKWGVKLKKPKIWLFFRKIVLKIILILFKKEGVIQEVLKIKIKIKVLCEE